MLLDLISRPAPEVKETEITLIGEKTTLDGHFRFGNLTRIHGMVKGTIYGEDKSTIIIAENAKIEGKIDADFLIIEGFVEGEIRARTKVTLTAHARVLGSIHAPDMKIEKGALLDASFEIKRRERFDTKKPVRG